MTATTLPFHLVNAFVVNSNPHSGNQAAVVIFPDASDARVKDDKWLTAVARDFNFSETAYLVPISQLEDGEGEWGLRWFTPEVEVTLCGHATLASAQVLFSLHPALQSIKFQTRFSGQLIASRIEDKVEITLPTLDTKTLSQESFGSINHDVEIEKLRKAFNMTDQDDGILGIFEMDFGGNRCLIVQMNGNVDVAAIKVNTKALLEVTGCAVVTQVDQAQSLQTKQLHVNSRVFGPALGIDEDPVTGSSHAHLTGYYFLSAATKYIPEELLQSVKTPSEITLVGHQRSSRGGELICRLDQNHHTYVKIVGKAHEFGKGSLHA
ncbi:uncharacterized protein I303_100937 [Kwoniella dejecticola CBS 10117]|uniref:Phenazine biosynthesis protein n=1 Tax=Kwoniella dejecticola CBS 10117 TaxID=1296121 RepID=A0A1A6AGC8_9TREE|nr:uncharacterized protein I303_00941 [Kwoniella dejecticola CBS 10117]OBR89119.1 hypothetical protein I303_00941 [Kwoniella dejecticola CBS 10117]